MRNTSSLSFKLVFTLISTWFIFSMVKISVLVPTLFSQEESLRFDFQQKYNDSEDRQLAFLFSPRGILSIDFLLIVAFLILGAYLYFPRDYTLSQQTKEKMEETRKSWNKILGIGFALLGALVTIFSVWRN